MLPAETATRPLRPGWTGFARAVGRIIYQNRVTRWRSCGPSPREGGRGGAARRRSCALSASFAASWSAVTKPAATAPGAETVSGFCATTWKPESLSDSSALAMRSRFALARFRCSTKRGSWRKSRASSASASSPFVTSAAKRNVASSKSFKTAFVKSCSSVMQTLSTRRFVATSQYASNNVHMSSTFEVVLTPCVPMYHLPNCRFTCALAAACLSLSPLTSDPGGTEFRTDCSATSKFFIRIWLMSSSMDSLVVYGSDSLAKTSSSFCFTPSPRSSSSVVQRWRTSLTKPGYVGARCCNKWSATACDASTYSLRQSSTYGRHSSMFWTMNP
mmetsp:Transcript_7141/g.22540  ORF Transcript_7141/g.22540 Transcript_7141/m.22540 type:complete len:331 (-) Transcript_7141:1585-2577(-)